MNTNPYTPPSSEVADPALSFQYAGFWIRAGAALIDALLIIAITYPILYAIYGASYFEQSDNSSFIAGPADFVISYVAPAVASVLFWRARQGTPGKLALSLRVVDASTGNTLSLGQAIGRYFAYVAAMIPLGLGLIWVAIDARKQGWHDKLAKTIVIRAAAAPKNAVVFDRQDGAT